MEEIYLVGVTSCTLMSSQYSFLDAFARIAIDPTMWMLHI